MALRIRWMSGSPISSTTRPIQLGLFAEDLQVHFLPQVAGNAADDTGEFLEDLVHRYHAHLEDLHLQFGGDEVHPLGELAELLVELMTLRVPLLQVLVELDHAVALQHQFTDLVHEVVQALDVHAHRGVVRQVVSFALGGLGRRRLLRHHLGGGLGSGHGTGLLDRGRLGRRLGGCRFGRGLLLGCGCLRRGGCLGLRLGSGGLGEQRQQLGNGPIDLPLLDIPPFDVAHQQLDQVGGLQDDIHDLRGHQQLSLAKAVEHVLGFVGHLDQQIETEEARCSLDGVDGPENPVEQVRVFR